MIGTPIRIRIKTLTPLLTGGVTGTTDRLHETGIMGSLRWWYESVVRGLGGYACDSTSAVRCELNGREKDDTERMSRLCAACYLFGCSGWKRRFRLEVADDGRNSPFHLATLDAEGGPNYWWLSRIFENSLGTSLPLGEITLTFKHVEGDDVARQLAALISVMSHIGAIGAKTQYGFGQFDFEGKMELKEGINAIQAFLKRNKFKVNRNKAGWYSLDRFWLHELKLSSQNKLVKEFQRATVVGTGPIPEDCLPVSFDIRYKLPKPALGHGLREEYYLKHMDKRKTREIFGTLDKERTGSRIFVSHLFKTNKTDDSYRLRVWGFTEVSIGREIGEELKGMFALEELPPMIAGSNIIAGDIT